MKLIQKVTHCEIELDELEVLKEMKTAFGAEMQAITESQVTEEFKTVVNKFMSLQME